MSTYLQLVNDVLIRLREGEVQSVQDTLYSKLIGKFINDSKRRVEDSFDWNVLGESVTVTCVGGTYSYVLTGIQGNVKVIDVLDSTNHYELKNRPVAWMNKQRTLTTVQNGNPAYYCINGVDTNGDLKIEFFPTPDSVDSIQVNLTVPQAALSSDSTVLSVPSEPVILGAYSLAIAERGEDGSVTSGDAYNLYKMALADAIAIESSRYCENQEWVAV